MATTAKPKTPNAFKALTDTLGSKPPKALAELPEADLLHLSDQVEQALAHHQESVATAEESIINSAPRPLRGTIRKIFAG